MVGAGHRFTADLRGAIKVLVVVRVVLSHRVLYGVAVDRGRGRINEAPDAGLTAGVKHVERALDVDLESAARILVALQQPQRCEMEDRIDTLQRIGENVNLCDIAAGLEDLHAWITQRAAKIVQAAPEE